MKPLTKKDREKMEKIEIPSQHDRSTHMKGSDELGNKKAKAARRITKRNIKSSRKQLEEKGIKIGSQTPKIKLVNVSDLQTGPYQRPLDTIWLNKIIKNWNETFLMVISVSERDGKLYVIDGWHRVTAAKTVGKKKLWAAVYQDMTVQEEAHFFATQMNRTKNVHAIETHKANLVANEPVALMIESVVMSAGFKVARSGVGAIRSVTTLRKILGGGTLREYFSDKNINGTREEIVREALEMINTIWRGEGESTKAWYIQGMIQFVCECHLQEVNINDVINKLKKIDPSTVQQRTIRKKNREGEQGSVACCLAFIEQYNSGKKSRRMYLSHTSKATNPIR